MISWQTLVPLFENQFREKELPANAHLELHALTFNEGKDDFFMFAIESINLVNFSNQELFPDQLNRIASRELCSKLPMQWQKELDHLHQEDGRRATFSCDKEWCLKQQCNDEAFAECKEIVKTSAPDDKKDQQQSHTKPAGLVHKVQSEAGPFKGCRREGGKGRSDSSQNEPQFQAADNVGYQQAVQGGLGEQQQPQHYYPPSPPHRHRHCHHNYHIRMCPDTIFACGHRTRTLTQTFNRTITWH